MVNNSKVPIIRVDGLEERLHDIETKSVVGRNVGQVFWSQSNARQDNPHALPLFTGEHVAISDYGALYSFILRNPAVQTTKSIYDALVANPDVDCPYYAVDNGYIYLPILRNYLNTVWAEEEESTESVTVNTPVQATHWYRGWTAYTATLYAWTGNAYTTSPTPSVGDPVYKADGTRYPTTVGSVSSGSIYVNGWQFQTISLVGTVQGWTAYRDAANDVNGITTNIYTESDTPTVGNTVYSDTHGTVLGTVSSVSGSTITATYTSDSSTVTADRNNTLDESYTVTESSMASNTATVAGDTYLHVDKANLYPWVSYVATIADTQTQYAYVQSAGDVMYGNLEIQHSSNPGLVVTYPNVKSYYIHTNSYGSLHLGDTATGKGLYLEPQDGCKPYYWDGTSGIPIVGKSVIATNYDAATNIWYIVFSDRTVLQGGQSSSMVANFPYPFADTNYTFLTQGNAGSGDWWAMGVTKYPTYATATWNGDYTVSSIMSWIAYGLRDTTI